MRTSTRCVVAVAVVLALAGCTAGVAPGTVTAADPGGAGRPAPIGAAGTLAVHFIDTGLGTSTLVVGPTNETMLIDSGDWQDDGEHVLAYLRAHGIDRIDYLVSTHADADHIGGQAAVIEYLETRGDGVGAVYDPGIAASTRTYGRYLDAIERYDVPLYETRAGDRIPLAGVDLTVLSPPEPYLAGGDRNENSIVVRVGFGAASFFFPGDAAERSEQFMVDRYGARLNATVLLAGHHGSETSSSDPFLDAVAPHLAVISGPYDSQYGHPHEAVLQRLAARSVRTYWTATHGDVVMRTNGSALSVATQRAAPTDPLALRDGEPVSPSADDPVTVRTVFALAGSAPRPVATDGGTEGASPTATPEPTPDSSATEGATDGGSTGGLSVAAVRADAAGQEADNLLDEYVVFVNEGDRPLDLSGWTVVDEADHRYAFPDGFTLDPGARVTLHTGSGTDTATDLYWGADAPVWNDDGDTVVVRDASGERVTAVSYP